MNPVAGNIEIVLTVPVIAALLLLLIPLRYEKAKGFAALAVSLLVVYFMIMIHSSVKEPESINLLVRGNIFSGLQQYLPPSAGDFIMIYADRLSAFTMMLGGIFTALIIFYSLFYFDASNRIRNYYSYILITLWSSAGAFLSDSLFMFIFFWGILGITLYKMIPGHDEESAGAAKKTFIIIGSSDGIMILGLGILLKISGEFNMSELSVRTSDLIRTCAYLAFVTGSFAKGGAFPMHTWIPDYTKYAPATSSAYLPASLDKLLGLYFLVRLTNEIFIISDWIRFIIILAGTLTIIIAVMMALIQHNYKKLLGYHSVSQFGYMITGIALGTTLGIAGGLFHMLNNAVYKSGLFLVAGNVSKTTGRDNLEDLGGLSRVMPITFVCCLIFALSISGVPPFNGFSSKWLIYQGIIDFGTGTGIASRLWILWLAMAVTGSALTLASFIKLISGMFLGRIKSKYEHVREVSILMLLPAIILALVCVITGIFASGWFVPTFIEPLTGRISYTGIWDSSMVSLLVVISILLGMAIYFVTGMKLRRDDAFVGGEVPKSDMGLEPVRFYDAIRNSAIFKPFYDWANRKYFDIYDLSKSFVLKISGYLSSVHNGILSNLAFWIVAGMILIFLILMI